jgi:hypothetical protein
MYKNRTIKNLILSSVVMILTIITFVNIKLLSLIFLVIFHIIFTYVIIVKQQLLLLNFKSILSYKFW